MLVACFDTHISHNNEYVCQRLSASWLAGAGEPFNLGLFLTAGMVATAVVFYMLRHCSIPRPARQINAPTVRAQSLRELRTQLEQIPRETRRPQPARESPDACPDEAPSGLGRGAPHVSSAGACFCHALQAENPIQSLFCL